MEFHERRRQQFLSERHYRFALDSFDEVVNGPGGLLDNLKKPDDPPGWHKNLAQGVGDERFNRLLISYTAGEPIEPLRAEVEAAVLAYERYAPLLWKYLNDRNEPVFKFYSQDDYCQLMQLLGLCFLLHRRDLLPKIAFLQDGLDAIGQVGEGTGGTDTLYEEFMAYGLGSEVRYASDTLTASKPYEPLFHALTETSPGAALVEIDRFLQRWYKDLSGCGWHDTHKAAENGSQAGYYGYWSFEAGAAVVLLGIEDDSSLHKYLYYPKDLVAWCRANSALSDEAEKAVTRLRCLAGQPCPRAGHWFTPARPDSRRSFQQGEVMPDVGGDYGVTIWQWDAQP